MCLHQYLVTFLGIQLHVKVPRKPDHTLLLVDKKCSVGGPTKCLYNKKQVEDD